MVQSSSGGCAMQACRVSRIAIISRPMRRTRTGIPTIASRGWVIVTHDFAIKRRPNEREAWAVANAMVVMVRGERLSAEDMAKLLLAAHAQGRLDNYIAKRTPPMILYLNPDGRLHTHLGGERRGGRKKT